jgi:hypothetical protein
MGVDLDIIMQTAATARIDMIFFIGDSSELLTRRDAETVKHPVVGSDVDAAVCYGETAEMIERRDLIPARP